MRFDSHQQLIDHLFANPSDEDAFEELDATLGHEIRVYLAARANGNSDCALDAYQNALVRFIELFQRGADRPITPGYLMAIAKNCLIDEFRAQRETPHPLDEMLALCAQEGLMTETPNLERRLQLLDAMNSLDNRCRYIVENFYLTGLSTSDLAPLLGVAPDSVYEYLARCRHKLLDLMAK